MKFIKKLTVISSLLIATAVVEANMNSRDVNDFINNQVRIEEQIRGEANSSPLSDIRQPPISQQNQSFIDQLKRKQPDILSNDGVERKETPDAYYFVSFSIPTEGLKRMVAEADMFHIPATIRGLINNDMTQTVTAVHELVKESKRGGVQIDPQPFMTYGIQSVPVLVVLCGNNQFDKISGNLRLREALENIAKSGECSETAQRLLEGGKK